VIRLEFIDHAADSVRFDAVLPRLPGKAGKAATRVTRGDKTVPHA
jgi:hypothetical protein